MSRERRILFIQYANPAAYPPLLHGTRILAREGWQVRVLGVETPGTLPLEWPRTEGVDCRVMRGTPVGLLLKLQYLIYTAWVVAWALRWRPAVVYASDPLAAPVALVVTRLTGSRLVYHEHDSPGTPRGAGARAVARRRERAARKADLCVLPNAQRAEAFARDTGAAPARVLCVWNCPARDEVRARPQPSRAHVAVYFHGSINEARLPLAVLDAIARLPGDVRLEFAGYETLGSRGYVERFLRHGGERGLARDRLTFLGAGSRAQVLEWASRCDVGLALMPLDSGDINMRFMVGASNKPFDYLAVGLPLVVTRLPEWDEAFVKPGYGVSCDPADAASIAAALEPLVTDAARRRAMANAGRARIEQDWSYEHQFRPVAERLRGWAEEAS